MNTVSKTCRNKVFVTKVQQMWKHSYTEQKPVKYVSWCYVYSVNYSCSTALIENVRSRKILELIPAAASRQATRLLNVSKNRCWKCNAVITERDLVCMSCGCVQEPKQNLNNFEIFKETPQFDIDSRNLTVKFRRLQNLLHPDKFASRSEKEKEYSAEQSARVNKAYQTLLRPMDRGIYLLELHGKPLLEDEIQLPSDFLSDVMEINEMLDACKSAEVLESVRHVNDAKLQMLFADVSLSFKEKNINKARTLICKLKYFTNIDAKIKKLEEKFGVSRDE